LIQIGAARPRLPDWARRSRTHFESLNRLKTAFRALNLHTVCESARCPNIHECFHRGAATFMILGNWCTRGCGFCSVPKANPARTDMRLDSAEPSSVARMAAAMKLRYVVITSVNRDDLADGGSRHFAETVRRVLQALPEARVEALIPDFNGDLDGAGRVLEAGAHVLNHNVETVARLYRRVRPQADYRRSLRVLAFASRWGRGRGEDSPACDSRMAVRVGHARPADDAPSPSRGREGAVGMVISEPSPSEGSPCSDGPVAGEAAFPAGADRARQAGAGGFACPSPAPSARLTKSGFMVGLGETEAEVRELLDDLRRAGTDVATIGQYLQPTRRNLPVAAYIEPRQFEAYREYGLSLGFKMVFSGPLVRSSYMADAVSEEALRPPC